MRVGICGLGTVGSGVFNLVSRNASEILRKTGSSIEIAQVGCRRDHPDVELGSTNVTRDIFEVARNPDVDVVLELIGGIDRARELLVIALENKKHVVTANKALIATHGDELFALAEKMGVQLRYEAAIAGGIPIVKAIREGLAANRISWLAGIINGTSNFILTEMEQSGSDLAFSEVLKQAQDLGYAEADPTFDIEGIDAAHKLTILSSIAFGVPLEFDAMYTQGISKITTEDIQYADELGYKIRHLGITRRSELGIELRVHPTLIRKEEMLAQVNGVMNAVMVSSDAAGRTMYYGAGAGAGPTASSVVADIIDIVRGQGSPGIANLGFVNEGFVKDKTLPILDIEDITSACYLKLNVIDQPGVMARLTAILSHHKISIEALIQKDAQGGFAAIVIVTDEVVERSMNAAIKELESLDEVRGSVTHIRITDLQD
ncbi:MAG: homoserine dehydrogenase [Pseudomonadales bacterium]